MEEKVFLAENQPLVYAQIKKSIQHGRLAHAYLFEGDKGTGKEIMSKWLAKRLFCSDVQDNEPCNVCNNCLRIEADEHPNVQVVAPDGQSIKVDQIRQLQQEFNKSGFEERQQFFVLREAEKMNVSAANSLLKFLEEPQGSFVAVLETEALGRILPTIQSRCQIIHFTPLNTDQLVTNLMAQQIGEESTRLLASLTNSLEKAVEISENEWFNDAKDAVKKWYTYLEQQNWQAFVYVQKTLLPLAKEKDQQQQLLAMLIYFYRNARDSQKSAIAVKKANQALEAILAGQQKLRSNVAFQSVAEQLVIRIMKG